MMQLSDYDKNRWTPFRAKERILEILAKENQPLNGAAIREHMPSCPENVMRNQVTTLLAKGELLSDRARKPVYWRNPAADNTLFIMQLWRTTPTATSSLRTSSGQERREGIKHETL